MTRALRIALLLLLTSACAPAPPLAEEPPGDTNLAPPLEPQDRVSPNPTRPMSDLDAFPVDPSSTARVCARAPTDAVGRRLCASPAPEIRSLVDLHRAIGLGEDNPSRGSVANTNSTSLAAIHTTSLNPRVIVFDQGISAGDQRAAGFVRGETVVELIGAAPDGTIKLYVVRFELPCGADCGLVDLLGPAIEHGWTRWSLYQDIDLVNTPIDCLVCHQPDGPGGHRMGRMQELRAPWSHYFPASGMGMTETSRVVQPRFEEAHAGEERYGGVLLEHLVERVEAGAQPASGGANAFETFVASLGPTVDHPGGDSTQSDLQAFSSFLVESELQSGSKATWLGYQADVQRGIRIPIPHFSVDPSDDARRSRAAAWYRAAALGGQTGGEVHDLRDILSTTAKQELSRLPSADEDAPTLLRHFCGRCHNDKLDRTLSRARFDVSDLAALTSSARATAIARVKLPEGSIGVMPPPRFAVLLPEARQKIVDYLSR